MSIANYLTALDAQRDQLARNLVTMGVQASESEKLNTLGRCSATAMMLLPHTVRASTLFILTDTAASRALLTCILISAARRTPMHFTTISRILTGALSFTPCVSLRYASRLQAEFCLPTNPARPMQVKCGWCARAVSRCRQRKRQDTFMKSSAAVRQSPFRSAGSVPSATISPSCTTVAVYLLTNIISHGKR